MKIELLADSTIDGKRVVVGTVREVADHVGKRFIDYGRARPANTDAKDAYEKAKEAANTKPAPKKRTAEKKTDDVRTPDPEE